MMSPETRSTQASGRSSLMQVGRRVDYAVRALAYLAAQPPGAAIRKAEIEQRQDIPSHYLSKIMRDLVAAGLVQSHIGRIGGFSLARPGTSISIKAVYEAVERHLVVIECLEQGEAYCPYCTVCTQISMWDGARRLLAEYLASISIGDIADQQGLRVLLQHVPR